MEEWNENRLKTLLPRQFSIIEKLNDRFLNKVKEKFPNDNDKIDRMTLIKDGQIRMANIAIMGSRHVNGVSKMHTEILKNTIFKDFYEMYPEKFISITNGITQRRWLLYANPLLFAFITKNNDVIFKEAL